MKPLKPRHTGSRKKATPKKKTAPKKVGKPEAGKKPAKAPAKPKATKPLAAPKKKGLVERVISKTVENAIMSSVAPKPATPAPHPTTPSTKAGKDEEE